MNRITVFELRPIHDCLCLSVSPLLLAMSPLSHILIFIEYSNVQAMMKLEMHGFQKVYITFLRSLTRFANKKKKESNNHNNQYEPTSGGQKSTFPSCKRRLWLVACSIFGYKRIGQHFGRSPIYRNHIP